MTKWTISQGKQKSLCRAAQICRHDIPCNCDTHGGSRRIGAASRGHRCVSSRQDIRPVHSNCDPVVAVRAFLLARASEQAARIKKIAESFPAYLFWHHILLRRKTTKMDTKGRIARLSALGGFLCVAALIRTVAGITGEASDISGFLGLAGRSVAIFAIDPLAWGGLILVALVAIACRQDIRNWWQERTANDNSNSLTDQPKLNLVFDDFRLAWLYEHGPNGAGQFARKA